MRLVLRGIFEAALATFSVSGPPCGGVLVRGVWTHRSGFALSVSGGSHESYQTWRVRADGRERGGVIPPGAIRSSRLPALGKVMSSADDP